MTSQDMPPPKEAGSAGHVVTRDAEGVAHFVPLSGGKDSTCTAVLLAEREPRPYNYVCTPTGDELPEMIEHWRKLEALLGRPIIMIPAPTLKQVIASERCLPNHQKRFCTRKIKLVPFREFVCAHAPAVIYVGLRADEPHEDRAGFIYGDALDITQRFILRELGYDEQAVWAELGERGIVIPKRTDCARCFWQKLGEWYELWLYHRDIFNDAMAEEEATGHTFRSPSRDTWPAALKDLAALFAAGKKPERSLRMMEKRTGMCRVCSL